jgi:hypothetical protein
MTSAHLQALDPFARADKLARAGASRRVRQEAPAPKIVHAAAPAPKIVHAMIEQH